MEDDFLTPDDSLGLTADFDPLADIEFEYDPMSYVPPIEKPDDYDEEPQDLRDEVPAEERIAKAFKGMPGNEKLLQHIISFCEEEVASDALYEEVERFLNGRISVYAPEILCSNLINAGAIEIVQDQIEIEQPDTLQQSELDGDPALAEATFEPIDQTPTFSYKATSAGLAFIASIDTPGELRAFLLRNELYEPVITAVLEACAREGGATKKEIDGLVDKHPLCQKPRRRSGFFLKNLEDLDVLIFDDSWKVTEIGAALLNEQHQHR